MTCIPGRIHSAVISSVNNESRSVTVEWFERGETKGKEVSMQEYYCNSISFMHDQLAILKIILMFKLLSSFRISFYLMELSLINLI